MRRRDQPSIVEHHDAGLADAVGAAECLGLTAGDQGDVHERAAPRFSICSPDAWAHSR